MLKRDLGWFDFVRLGSLLSYNTVQISLCHSSRARWRYPKSIVRCERGILYHRWSSTRGSVLELDFQSGGRELGLSVEILTLRLICL
jgi:hypothetical protein